VTAELGTCTACGGEEFVVLIRGITPGVYICGDCASSILWAVAHAETPDYVELKEDGEPPW